MEVIRRGKSSFDLGRRYCVLLRKSWPSRPYLMNKRAFSGTTAPASAAFQCLTSRVSALNNDTRLLGAAFHAMLYRLLRSTTITWTLGYKRSRGQDEQTDSLYISPEGFSS